MYEIREDIYALGGGDFVECILMRPYVHKESVEALVVNIPINYFTIPVEDIQSLKSTIAGGEGSLPRLEVPAQQIEHIYESIMASKSGILLPLSQRMDEVRWWVGAMVWHQRRIARTCVTTFIFSIPITMLKQIPEALRTSAPSTIREDGVECSIFGDATVGIQGPAGCAKTLHRSLVPHLLTWYSRT